MNDSITIAFKARNTLRGTWEYLFEPVHLDDLTDDHIQLVIDNATSASSFCSKDSEVPDTVQHMNDIKAMLNWKGDVKVTPFVKEQNGQEVSGISVNLQRDKSRSLSLVGFKERLAGLVR